MATKTRLKGARLDRMVKKVKRLAAEGLLQREIAKKVGLSQSSVCRLMATADVKGTMPGYSASLRGTSAARIETELGDPATLSKEDMEACLRLGISPARMAFVLSCPRGGNFNNR